MLEQIKSFNGSEIKRSEGHIVGYGPELLLTPADIPISMKTEIQEYLKEKGWEPKEIVDPTLLKRMCRTT